MHIRSSSTATMVYAEFCRQLSKAGYTVQEFAARVRMCSNSVSNYSKKGAVPSHLAVISVLLAELAEHNIDTRILLSKIELHSKKPRGAGIGKFGGNKQLVLFAPDGGGDQARTNAQTAFRQDRGA